MTWDTSYFADANTVVSIHGDYLDGKNEDGGKGTGQVFEGFVSEIDLRAGLGFFAWTVDPDMLGNSARRRVNLWLAIESTTGQIVQTLDGPDVFLVKGESKPKSGPNLALLVAVPVVVGLVLLAAAAVGCFFFLRRRRVLGARRRASAASSGSGYGIRKSASQRVGAGDKAGVNIMLSPTSPTGPRPGEPWGAPQMPAPPAPGQNVFREELRRQERERI